MPDDFDAFLRQRITASDAFVGGNYGPLGAISTGIRTGCPRTSNESGAFPEPALHGLPVDMAAFTREAVMVVVADQVDVPLRVVRTPQANEANHAASGAD